jgi:DNA-binding NtrC family response regulator
MYPASVSSPSSMPSATAQAASSSRTRTRNVLVVSSDSSLRERLRNALTGLRWQVLEASGGAEAWNASQSTTQLEALLIDQWLPDLDVEEFLQDFNRDYPTVDLMMTDGVAASDSPRSPYRQELLYALRRSQDGDTAAWQAAPTMAEEANSARQLAELPHLPSWSGSSSSQEKDSSNNLAATSLTGIPVPTFENVVVAGGDAEPGSAYSYRALLRDLSLPANPLAGGALKEKVNSEPIPELIGSSPVMLEVSRRIRLVAARSTPVLIEGPTGSGKELVAEALHRLSSRSRKPFVAINCAAIPEALLESELFGHTRGAFTGAVQGRIGRIEAADGGTLFLDEIGEMPLSLQSKLLRFFESGELQKIGDNETVKVDVRIVTATHQPLAENAQKGQFRADLYYRLAVFLIRTPALSEHMDDLPQLVSHFVERMGRRMPVKRIDASAMTKLAGHAWPGNVRELEHVLERASILAGDDPLITVGEIDFGLSLLN